MHNTLQSSIVKFYLCEGLDVSGRSLDTILSWDDLRLEEVHDYIQWLFPLREKSAYNSSAPVLNEEEVEIFRTDDNLKTKLAESFRRMLSFYGFECHEAGDQPIILCSNNFEQRSQNWLTKYNHNHLRITRILKCISLLGLEPHANAFMRTLEEVYSKNTEVVGLETLNYWREAVR